MYKNKTALMNAAKAGTITGVRTLLSAGADPNIVNIRGMTALAFGIVSGNNVVVKLLASRTSTGVGVKNILIKLAQADFDIEGPLETYLDAITKEQKSLLLERASFFGNAKLLDYLLNKSNNSWSRHELRAAIENAEQSEKFNAVLTLQRYFNKIDGKMMIMKMIMMKNKQKKNLKYDILNKVPKSKEFEYANTLKEISALIESSRIIPSLGEVNSGRLIKYEELIKHLHAPPIHYRGSNLVSDAPLKCPDDCVQKMICGRVRDAISLVDQIMLKMSLLYPIFKNVTSLVVGSVKERTKVGKIDEADISLFFSKEFQDKVQKFFEFSKDDHQLLVKR